MALGLLLAVGAAVGWRGQRRRAAPWGKSRRRRRRFIGGAARVLGGLGVRAIRCDGWVTRRTSGRVQGGAGQGCDSGCSITAAAAALSRRRGARVGFQGRGCVRQGAGGRGCGGTDAEAGCSSPLQCQRRRRGDGGAPLLARVGDRTGSRLGLGCWAWQASCASWAERGGWAKRPGRVGGAGHAGVLGQEERVERKGKERRREIWPKENRKGEEFSLFAKMIGRERKKKLR